MILNPFYGQPYQPFHDLKDTGASLGDILGEALDKNSSEKDSDDEGGND